MCPQLDWMNMRSFFEAISVSCVVPAAIAAGQAANALCSRHLVLPWTRRDRRSGGTVRLRQESSLLTACARLNPHAHGTFALDGVGSDEFSAQQWRRDVSYLPQNRY